MNILNIISLKQWIKHQYNSQLFWIRFGVIGIWYIVFLLSRPISEKEDDAIDVYVKGGWINVENTVDVSGSDVNINEVNDVVTVYGTVNTW